MDAHLAVVGATDGAVDEGRAEEIGFGDQIGT